MYLNGDGIAGKDARGNAITDDHFLLYFNADGPAEVTLPPDEFAAAWDVVIDTGRLRRGRETHEAGGDVPPRTRSLVVLREHAEAEAEPDHSVAASLAALSGPAPSRPRRRPTAGTGRTSACGPPAAPTGSRSPRSSTCSRRPPAGLPARPRRRLGLPLAAAGGGAGQRPRLRRGGPRPGRPSRGGAEGLAALSAEARRLGLGVLVDIVPNHVGVATPAEDAWWWDVLALGRESAVRRRRSTSTGPPGAAGSGSRWSATTTRPGRRADRAPARSSTASCATTTTATRSRPARPTTRPTLEAPTARWSTRTPCTRASTTSWSTGTSPTTA